MLKLCFTCKQYKDVSLFSKNKSKKDGLQSSCKECKHNYDKNYYNNNEKDRINRRIHAKISVKKSRDFVLKYLSTHPCVDCGETDPVVLEFDHKVNKSNSISVMVCRAFSETNLLKEIEKCEIRCANCHRRKTAKEFKYYRFTGE